MKACLRLAVLCGIAFFLSSVASADDIHVTLDPSTPIVSGSYDLILAQGTAYSVTWVSCSDPAFIGTGLQGDQACLAFINKSSAPIAELNLTFTNLVGLDNQTVTCDNLDSYLTGNSCASVPTIQAGGTYSFDFFGGDAIGNGLAFYLGETGVSLADMQADPWSVDVPEPGTLVLLLAGLGALFLFGFRRPQTLQSC